MKHFNYIIFCLFGLVSQSSFAQDKIYAQMGENELREHFTELTQRRVNDLSKNIEAIVDRNRQKDLRKEIVDNTVKYFEDETKVFEVSSKNRSSVRSIPVREYLLRLMVLPYDKVEIKWFKTKWISDIYKTPDDKYKGVVKIFQAFIGRNSEGDIIYEDITEKRIEVTVEILNQDLGDEVRQIFSVKLGDVSVLETR